MGIRVKTARLVIRPFDDNDADTWYAMLNDPEVRQFIPGRDQPDDGDV